MQGLRRQLAQQTSLPSDRPKRGLSASSRVADPLARYELGAGSRGVHAPAEAAALNLGCDGEGMPGSSVNQRWLQQARMLPPITCASCLVLAMDCAWSAMRGWGAGQRYGMRNSLI